jgi:hypothetical protein
MKEDQTTKMEEQTQVYEAKIAQLKSDSEQNIKKLTT